jgi:hypothetical protein
MAERPEQFDKALIAEMGALLWQWGRVSEMSRNWTGFRTGHEGGGLGLPIPNIPSIVIQVGLQVRRLPDDYSNAVTIWYAWHLNPGGGWWSNADKALALGLNEHTLKSRVRRAKELLLLAAPELLQQPLE